MNYSKIFNIFPLCEASRRSQVNRPIPHCERVLGNFAFPFGSLTETESPESFTKLRWALDNLLTTTLH